MDITVVDTTLNMISRHLYLLNCIHLTEEEGIILKKIHSDLFKNNDWDTWYQLVELNACHSLVYLSLMKLNLKIPEPFESKIREKYNLVSLANRRRLESAQPIFKNLQTENIPFILLKGQSLMISLYHDINYKKMNDVDFLVRFDDLSKLEKIYHQQKLICAAQLGNGHFRKQEAYSHHWPPFFTRNLHCVLGTHWGLNTPLSKIKIPIQEFWKQSESIFYLDIKAAQLCDLHQFFHLLVHLAYYKTGLKELCDPINLYREKKNNINLVDLKHLIFKTNSFDPIFRNLSIINMFLNSDELSLLINDIKPHVTRFVLNDTKNRIKNLYTTVRSRSTQTSRIEKSYALFSLAETPWEKAFFLFKMWQYFILPDKKEIIKMHNLSDTPSAFQIAKAYLKNPYTLSRVFAFDLGWKLHFLLILKHHYDLITCTIMWFFHIILLKKTGSQFLSLDQKLKILNLPFDSISQLKDLLE